VIQQVGFRIPDFQWLFDLRLDPILERQNVPLDANRWYEIQFFVSWFRLAVKARAGFLK